MGVLGRATELAALDDLLDAEPPRALVLDGAAGIGKTTLWRAGVTAAAERGLRVLSCAAVQSEAQLAFTAVRDLIDAQFDDVASDLAEPQRQALAVTLLREPVGQHPADPSAIAVAFLAALRAFAERGRTLVAIDDVQWLDVASEASLRYALRRLEHEQLHVLLTRRPRGGDAPPLGLDQLEPPAVRTVELTPLSVGALARLVHDRLGVTYPRPTLQRLHHVSNGNPLFAIELARALGQQGKPLAAGEPLPVPETLDELVLDRLTALPAETVDAMLVASALSRPTLSLLEGVLGEDVQARLAPAFAAEVIDPGADGDLRFRHPLFAAAVYARAGPDRRLEVHRRLADLVDDPEERARHLGLGTTRPTGAVASAVEEGAVAAFSRGSPETAAELAGNARRLTPAGDKDGARRRALAEVDYEFAAGDTARALALLEPIVAATPPGRERAPLLSRQARLLHFGEDIGASVLLLERALEEAGSGDPALRGEIEEGLAWGLLLVRRDLRAAHGHAASAVRLAADRGDDAALAEAHAIEALTALVLGRPWRASMEQALSLEEATLGLRVLRHPSFAFGYCLSCSDELDAARDQFAELRRRANERGDEGSLPSILNHLTLVECLSDNWAAAEALAEEGFERALESNQRPTQASILAKRGLLAARRGAEEEARSLVTEALEVAAGTDVDLTRPERAMARGGETAIWALGFLELSLDRPDRADAVLGPMARALIAAGVADPGEIRCLPDWIEALVALDRLDEADQLVGMLEAWGVTLGRDSVRGTAARARGLLLERRGEAAAALDALEAAARHHEGSGMPFEHARTLLALGEAERRARHRKAARDTLERALAIFEGLGAELWVGSARAALRRIGGRAPAAGDLTPAERRIAELVAQGKTNKDVAGELVVSVHTVEGALTQIYRKLGVRSRTEMARRLDA